MASDPILVKSQEPETEELPSLRSEVWADYRPYLRAIVNDILVCGTLYVALVLFDRLTLMLPAHGWEGGFIPHLHSIAVLAIFAVFCWLSIIDIYNIHRKRRTRKRKRKAAKEVPQ
jgi:hypothetical protein